MEQVSSLVHLREVNDVVNAHLRAHLIIAWNFISLFNLYPKTGAREVREPKKVQEAELALPHLETLHARLQSADGIDFRD